jgi:large subunit ribosomal protein L21
MEYAIIRVGNKQHRVRDGETIVVERVRTDEGGTFAPEVLLGSAKVTAKVVAHERGPKIRIGKYRKRTGYKRHNGYRSAISRVTISLGAAKAAPAKKAPPKAEAAPAAKPEAALAPKPEAAPAPKPEAAAPTGLPAGYEHLTVVAIGTGAKTWSRPQLEAALAYEHEHAKRKGALAALESALAKEEG